MSRKQEIILCACGCGQTRPKYDNKGRERYYLPHHNLIVAGKKTRFKKGHKRTPHRFDVRTGKRVAEDYRNGFLQTELMKKYHVSNQTIHSVLDRYGVKRRNRSESMRIKWKRKEHREKQINSRKRMWANPQFQKKQQNRRHLHPNGFEQLFQETFPELDFVGDYSLFVGCKNPDFVVRGQPNKFVDLFGDYWHTEEEAEARRKYFEERGKELIIVWFSKWMEDSEEVFERMNGYIGQENLLCL